jgi:hypothetical protein
MQGGASSSLSSALGTADPITISVPSKDGDDAREFLRSKTTLMPSTSEATASATDGDQTESLDDAAQEVLRLRRDHQVASCKYCGIPTLDVSEAELESHAIALLRAAGLGVNSATFSDFSAGERICTECAGHEVTCDLCGRTLDAFIDEGQYVRARDDEAYVCLPCIGRLEGELADSRDW